MYKIRRAYTIEKKKSCNSLRKPTMMYKIEFSVKTVETNNSD